MKIGIFDSGLGGVITLNAIRNILPQYDYIYLGDTLNMPYGDKSPKLIYERTLLATRYLFAQGCQLVIVACNTASAVALRKLQQNFLSKNYPDRKILGVIVPTIEYVLESGYQKIGVVGTKMTIVKKVYSKEIFKINKSIEVWEKAIPGLADSLEKFPYDNCVFENLFAKQIADLNEKSIHSLILGCTHYGVIKKLFQKKVNSDTKVISQAKIVAQKTLLYLKNHPEINKLLSLDSQLKILLTKQNNNYRKIIDYWDLQNVKDAQYQIVKI